MWKREVKCYRSNGTKYCVHTYNETWSSKKTDSGFRTTLALTLTVAVLRRDSSGLDWLYWPEQ